jgi:hypothetical protein
LLIGLSVTILPLGSSEGMSALPRYSNFARYLRNARVKRGLSATEVAELVGVSGVSVHFWRRINAGLGTAT